MEYLDLVFDQYEVSDPNYICVTRNADVSPDDEALEKCAALGAELVKE